jgi:hypothetical protein
VFQESRGDTQVTPKKPGRDTRCVAPVASRENDLARTGENRASEQANQRLRHSQYAHAAAGRWLTSTRPIGGTFGADNKTPFTGFKMMLWSCNGAVISAAANQILFNDCKTGGGNLFVVDNFLAVPASTCGVV